MLEKQRVAWFPFRIFGNWRGEVALGEGEWKRPKPEPRTVSEVYEAAPRPRMVPHAPRGAGLYYVRLPGSNVNRVVDVYRRGTIWLASWSDIPEFEVLGSGYEFSDRPLPEPAEPTR
jgi:hypothetical protein